MIVRSKEKRKKRRKSVAKLIVINEEELIRQVSLRPVMYDRSLKPYRKYSLRQQCWKEISETMDAPVEELRKRWRSLRDTFVKHHRRMQSTTDENAINKHRNWVFYDKMSFLIPHLDGVNSFEYDNIVDEIGDNSDDAKSISCDSIVLSSSLQDVKNLHEHHVAKEVNAPQTSPSLTSSVFVSIPLNNIDTQSGASKTTPGHQCPSQVLNKCNAPRVNVQTAETNTVNNNALLMESDEKFLLSCAPALRRLTTRQNALARLKIQQILFEIEFEEQYN